MSNKLITADLTISMGISFDPSTGQLSITSTNQSISVSKIIEKNEVHIQTITNTQKKFGLLTLGARSVVGKKIPTGEVITLKFNGKEFSGKKITTHKTTKGRVDGLSSLYSEYENNLKVGSKLEVKFDLKTKVLELTSL